MSYFLVNGVKRLDGETSVSGAKNSVLPLLAATFLCNGECILHNCPMLSDVLVSLEILKHLGCRVKFEENTVTVDSDGCYGTEIPEELMREMRSSIVFMGAVAAKSGKAVMSMPGGCELGPRPIDLHIDALHRLGAEISHTNGCVVCNLPEKATGTVISLKFPSVGATENIILASCTGKGTTVIHNAAREPEITDLCVFLCKAGANINGFGTDTIVIDGVRKLHGTEHSVMPDRIAAATYLFAAGACSGCIKLNNVDNAHIMPVISALRDCGCSVEAGKDSVILSAGRNLKAFDIVSSQPYPGFPTDAGPPLIAFASRLCGTSVFIENIFDSRYRFIDELKRLGADIKTVGKVAVITGVADLCGADVAATDLRGGAALVVAAISAKGTSKISELGYIDRGYDSLETSLGMLGADIKRIRE